jgi:hypothetical protein
MSHIPLTSHPGDHREKKKNKRTSEKKNKTKNGWDICSNRHHGRTHIMYITPHAPLTPYTLKSTNPRKPITERHLLVVYSFASMQTLRSPGTPHEDEILAKVRRNRAAPVDWGSLPIACVSEWIMALG